MSWYSNHQGRGGGGGWDNNSHRGPAGQGKFGGFQACRGTLEISHGVSHSHVM